MITPEQLNQPGNGNRRVGFQQQECEKAPFPPAPKGQRSAIMFRLKPSEQAKFHPQSSPCVRVAVCHQRVHGRWNATMPKRPKTSLMVQEPGRVAYRCITKRLGQMASPAITALAGDFGVVLFFRGSWCPYCNAQLRAFQRAADSLAETGIRVAALSVDDEPTTAELIAKHSLTFPVGHSADARAIADLTGAFVNPDPVYLQSTGFVLDPAGKVVVSVYSSGAIGRLVPEDVIGLVRYLRQHATA
jgi:peroxiredoxin